MKRSEMVTYLHKLMNTYIEHEDKLEIAAVDEILEGLEHMGMQPPVRYVHFLSNGQKIPGSYEYGVADNSWEPEQS